MHGLSTLPIVVAVLFVLASWYVFWRALRHRPTRLRRWPERVAKISELQRGLPTAFVGRIRAVEPLLTSPLTDRACVFHRLTVDELLRDGPRQLFVSDERTDFVVEDATGRVRIIAKNARFQLTKSEHQESGLLQRMTPAQRAVLERREVGGLSFKAFRYREAVLSEGELVAVRGMIRPKAQEAYRSAPEELVIEAVIGHPLEVSDAPSVVALAAGDATTPAVLR